MSDFPTSFKLSRIPHQLIITLIFYNLITLVSANNHHIVECTSSCIIISTIFIISFTIIFCICIIYICYTNNNNDINENITNNTKLNTKAKKISFHVSNNSKLCQSNLGIHNGSHYSVKYSTSPRHKILNFINSKQNNKESTKGNPIPINLSKNNENIDNISENDECKTDIDDDIDIDTDNNDSDSIIIIPKKNIFIEKHNKKNNENNNNECDININRINISDLLDTNNIQHNKGLSVSSLIYETIEESIKKSIIERSQTFGDYNL